MKEREGKEGRGGEARAALRLLQCNLDSRGGLEDENMVHRVEEGEAF